MKHKQIRLVLHMAVCTVALMISEIANGQMMATNTQNENSTDKKIVATEKAASKKTKAIKSEVSVKIIPDAFKRALHVVAKTPYEKELSLYVFDVNGEMVASYKMMPGEKKTVSDLKKGSYVYHVFCDDEAVATGTMQFR